MPLPSQESMELLEAMLATPSPSGFEAKIQAVIRERMKPFAHEVHRDVHGNQWFVVNPKDSVRLMLSGHVDEIGLMVRYLTNAAEAIPIIVFLNDQFVEVGFWGPRPAECKRLMARGKAAGKIDVARERIGAFYTNDKHQSTVRELRGLFTLAAAKDV